MNFLVDAQLPPALTHWLIRQGHTAQHVDDLGLREAEDIAIWNYAANTSAIILTCAANTGAIILTKDEDFAGRAARTATGPVIVWLRIGNATNRALLQWLAPRWTQITLLLDAGDRLIEVR